MEIAYLALGSNLGDRLDTLRGARRALDESPGIRVLTSSALYETEPEGGPAGQPPYLNAVLRVATELPPAILLGRCLEIEADFGRERTKRWGARTLDIDLLLQGTGVLEGPDLVLPHPRLHRRRFVLAPLADLDPDLVHPLTGKTVDELLAGLGTDSAPVRRIADTW